MKTMIESISAALALGLLTASFPLAAHAAGEPASAAKKQLLPDDEAQAWTEVATAAKPPTRPAEWRENRPSRAQYQDWMEEQAEVQTVAADKAAEFIARFPKSEHFAAARKLQISSLSQASMLGKRDRDAELAKLINAAAADMSIPEADRFEFRLTKVRIDAGKIVQANPDAGKKAYCDGLLALQKEFPRNERIYSMLLSMAGGEEGDLGKKLAQIVASSPDAPAKLKARAQDIVDGKVFGAARNIGKPIAIKFTAVDGRGVDLAKLKGKVVLLDFWATWCHPCVVGIPRVKETYEKYHDQGFEIIGISFDNAGEKDKLIQFTKDKGMTWPQFYDGKGWENEFGQQFNIHSIPAMWLIGKDGSLADADARADLDSKVAKLLEAK
jgi:thiol-disulfide isomerase/thioredoxin